MTRDRSTYHAVLIGCGRIGATIDDEVRGHPTMGQQLPYSHAAGYEAADGVDLVAAADVDPEQLANARERYEIPRGYRDYREMIDVEEPDIVSIATGAKTHAEMVRFAADNGASAIYCEKPLCRSMDEADAMETACNRNDVHFNLGVLRRFTPIYRRIARMIADDVIGQPRAIIAQARGTWGLSAHSHTADMLLMLAGDDEVRWVQGESDFEETDIEENSLRRHPPIRMGYICFAGGTRGYLTQGGGLEFEIDGEDGKIRTFNNGQKANLRRERGEWGLLEEEPFPQVESKSATVECIEELVMALDGERQTTSAPIEIAVAGQEICMGWFVSHRRDGTRVSLPLDDEGRSFSVDPENGWEKG